MGEATLPQSISADLSQMVAGQIVLFNTSEEELDNQVSGHIYRIKPGGELKINPIKDQPRDKMSDKRMMEAAPTIVMNSDEVARHLLTQSGWYERGVTPVYGDSRDQTLKEEARKRYVKNRIARAIVVQTDWLATVQNAQKVPGSLPPIMPDRVRVEMDFLRRNQRQVERAERDRFVCTIDGFQTNDEDEMKRYITTNYAAHMQQAGHEDPSPFYQDLDARKQGIAAMYERQRAQALAQDEPKTDESKTAKFLIEKAEALGVNLTKADLLGLALQNSEVVSAVIERLAKKESTPAD